MIKIRNSSKMRSNNQSDFDEYPDIYNDFKVNEFEGRKKTNGSERTTYRTNRANKFMC
jgi:hypothetical protein